MLLKKTDNESLGGRGGGGVMGDGWWVMGWGLGVWGDGRGAYGVWGGRWCRAEASGVFQVLLKSNLTMDVLGQVWTISDIDNDSMLDQDEFCVVTI